MSRVALWICSFMLVLVCAGTGVARPTSSSGNRAADVLMVLPFEVNADKKHQNLELSLPTMLNKALADRGFTVVPQDQTFALLRANNIQSLSLTSAREIAQKGRAVTAIYGSLTQVGAGYSLDARLVDASGASAAYPLFIQGTSMNKVAEGVNQLATQISAMRSTDATIISDIQVRGTKVLDADVVLVRLLSRKGAAVNYATINQEMKRIWDMGYFTDITVDVEPSSQGPILVYTVQEKPRIGNIVIQGSDALSTDDVLTAMSTKTGAVLNEKMLAQDLQRIAEMYRKEGFYLAEVSHHVDGKSAGGTLFITIKEGNKLYIRNITIEGAQRLDQSELKDILALSERGFWSFITGSGTLKEEEIERDIAAITAYYMNKGFLDAKVGQPAVDFQEDGISVTFTVSEGPRYILGDVHIEGELIETNEELYAAIALDEIANKDEYFSYESMQKDAKALMSFYADYGYAFADVNPRMLRQPERTEVKNGEDAVVNILFTVEKRNKIYIRRTSIEGNYYTRDNVILREMRLVDGDVFHGQHLQRSIERLYRLRYFSNVEPELLPTENPGEVDLKIKVTEQNTGSLTGGVGYSTFYDFAVSIQLAETNLFGRGYGASFRTMFSGKANEFMFSFINPRYDDTELALGFDAYLLEQEYDDFDKDTLGITLRTAYPLGEYTQLYGGYRLDRYKISDLDDDAARLIREREGYNMSSVLFTGVLRDGTDRRDAPTSGNITRINLEYGGSFLGGDDNFFKPSIETSQYMRLWNNENVFHVRAKLAAAFENDGEAVPVFERFYLGGISTVRGYRSKDITPRDPISGDRIGGDRMGFANIEYIWTFQPKMGLAVVPFFDVGFALDQNTDYVWSDEIKRSVGVELRWRSPMGDLRFAYGYPLDDGRRGENLKGRFEFTMGQSF